MKLMNHKGEYEEMKFAAKYPCGACPRVMGVCEVRDPLSLGRSEFATLKSLAALDHPVYRSNIATQPIIILSFSLHFGAERPFWRPACIGDAA
jgi:hypothetical protein